jgi:hypothetical protein
MNGSRRLPLILSTAVALLVAIQLVPYGRNHTNPPHGQPVAWDSPRTLELARRACFDCHSNDTRWPWYASIAPLSWRIQTHVMEGREALNFTAFDSLNDKVRESAGEAAETVTKSEMPPADYGFAHPEAQLTMAERRELVSGLQAMFARYGEQGEREGRVERAGGRGERPASTNRTEREEGEERSHDPD